MAGNYLKNSHEFDGSHRFLAEELLQPMTDKCDLSRTNMWCSHFVQGVTLNRPERPRVFSRFENVIGGYSTALKFVPENAEVVSVFQKNALQKVYALRYADGTMDIHFAAPVKHLTESYGYVVDNTPMEGVRQGDVIPSGSLIRSWPCHDAEGNLMYGRNLRAVYMNHSGRTFEDGIVICESAAAAMSHTSVEKVVVTLNANDLCVNRYGDEKNYKGFPDVGELIQRGVLMVRRRINHDSILYDLSSEQLGKTNYDSDVPIYATGRVVDLDIYSNLSAEQLEKHTYNDQLLVYFQQWRQFQAWVLTTFGEAVAEGRGYTEDVAFWYARMDDALRVGEDGTLKAPAWRHEKTEYEGIILEFTVATVSPVGVGSKLTNRYGGKGVISKILKDSEMPVMKDGRRAQIVVNSLGVLNRLNPAQMFEMELNFIAEEVELRIAALVKDGNTAQAWILHQDLMSRCSPVYAEFLEENVVGEDRIAYLEEIASGTPIYLHEPPFFGNTDFDTLAEMYKHFGVEKQEFDSIEEPLVAGSMYFLKLRHEPKGKFSARSAKHLSISGVPTRNSRGVRNHTEHHSSTPLRVGEQEVQNLYAGADPAEIERFLRQYATDDVAREATIEALLLADDPFSLDRVEVPYSDTTRTAAGAQAYLNTIGMRLVPLGEEDMVDDREEEEE